MDVQMAPDVIKDSKRDVWEIGQDTVKNRYWIILPKKIKYWSATE